jgi:oligopeptide/dipeptide ABC transporter ATP-binding protein
VITIKGELPSPANPPSGCVFHTRCAQCMEICKKAKPEWKEVKPGHYVACHLYS